MNHAHKYNVAPPQDRTVDGILFDSKKEAKRYAQLKLVEKAGEITKLEPHPEFPITVNGMHVCTYVADFSYYDTDGLRVVEDVKGVRTPLYKLKKKLMEAVYRIRVLES